MALEQLVKSGKEWKKVLQLKSTEDTEELKPYRDTPEPLLPPVREDSPPPLEMAELSAETSEEFVLQQIVDMVKWGSTKNGTVSCQRPRGKGRFGAAVSKEDLARIVYDTAISKDVS